MPGLSAASKNYNLGAITAVLGPTNTGKTHYALERMAAYKSGMIGLPLRLLAREVYDKLSARLGRDRVALMTGEEKITPQRAAYWVCTVEAMPLERKVAFLAVDEIQLAADPERGRIFTHRLLHARGAEETLFLGSDTIRPVLRNLIRDIGFVARPRLSTLSYAGRQKLSRLPRRSAIVAFSTEAVYATAELIKRQRGGAAVVMGALSPRTRNAQAALYQNGDVDYLVATDAIGMGLNMDISHIAFAGAHKFDGRQMRALTPAELAQIAGRAGRHCKNGSFGVTAECPAFTQDLTEAIENHQFDPISALQWRSQRLDFSAPSALLASLMCKPDISPLLRAREDDDEAALRRLLKQRDIAQRATGGAALRLLWDVCQIPDFRRVTLDQHAQMISDIYHELMAHDRLRASWIAPRIERFSRLEGDVDALSHRLAHIRTWTYLCHRAAWVEDAQSWQARARKLEDALSDQLHEKLTQRFIDRRTSVLLKKLHETRDLHAGITEQGDVTVEGEFVGRLIGFEFILDPRAKGPNERAIRYAATRALQPELLARAGALMAAADTEFSIEPDGAIQWRQSIIATLEKGPLPLRPSLRLRAVEQLPAHTRPRIEERLQAYLIAQLEGLLGPLFAIKRALDKSSVFTARSDQPDAPLSAEARAVAFLLSENFGALPRSQVFREIKALSPDDRAALRRLGIRFGEFTIFLPALIKPAPARLLSMLWAIWHGHDIMSLQPPKAGLTSIEANPAMPAGFIAAAGYRLSGTIIVRIDIIERLGELVRLARQTGDARDGFEATSQMISLVGCSGAGFASVLESLGYKPVSIERHKATSPADHAEADPRKAKRDPPIKDKSATDPDLSPDTPDLCEVTMASDAPELGAESEAGVKTEVDGAAISAQTKNEMEINTEVETETVTLWKRAKPVRTRQKSKSDADFNRTKNNRATKSRPNNGEGKKPSGHKPGHPPRKGLRTYSSEKRGKSNQMDPDSPFAILSDLTRPK